MKIERYLCEVLASKKWMDFMNMKQLSKRIDSNNSQAIFLIFLCWLTYTTSYLGKLNYSANITQIIDFYGINKTQAGTVPTFFFFAYGIGQVFNGVFCKRYNIKWIIFLSLIVSASINLIIAVGLNFSIMKWLWLVNGFVLSILWPTIVRLLSESLPKKALGTSSVIMGTTVAIGTLLIYGLSSLYAAFDKFKMSFYTAGIAVIIVAIVWIIFYDRAVSGAKNDREKEDGFEQCNTNIAEQIHSEKDEKNLLFISIYILCFFAVGVNLIKDGLTTWLPSILKEEFAISDSISILLTLFLPVLAVFGNAGALKMHKVIPDYLNHCVAVFAVIIVFVCGIIAGLTFEIIYFMFIGLVIVSFLASSLNGLITSIFPLLMRGKVNSGLLAGVLNGFCYLGSTISSYGLGVIADRFGWNAVFWVLIGVCTINTVVWFGYICIKRFLNKN